MDSYNRYAKVSTDALLDDLRILASAYSRCDTRDKIEAAIDRLHTLYHDTPSSARVSSEGTSEPMVTKREAVLRQRKAFGEGVIAERACALGAEWDFGKSLAQLLAERYPLPKISRPRVAIDYEQTREFEQPREWRCVNGGTLESRACGPDTDCNGQPIARPWRNRVQVIPTPTRLKMWADLLENPNELVEDVSSLPALDGRE